MRQKDLEEFARWTAEQAAVVREQWEAFESRDAPRHEARARLSHVARLLFALEDPRAACALLAMETDPSAGTCTLRPYDVVVAIGLSRGITASAVREQLSLDVDLIGPSLDRLQRASIVCPEAPRSASSSAAPEAGVRLRREALCEFLVHGARYAFPAARGGWTRGVPTAHSAVDLTDGSLRDPESDPYVALDEPLVWPAEDGPLVGEGVTPLFRLAPSLRSRAPEVYRVLALVDCHRVAGMRERVGARESLRRSLGLPL